MLVAGLPTVLPLLPLVFLARVVPCRGGFTVVSWIFPGDRSPGSRDSRHELTTAMQHLLVVFLYCKGQNQTNVKGW